MVLPQQAGKATVYKPLQMAV